MSNLTIFYVSLGASLLLFILTIINSLYGFFVDRCIKISLTGVVAYKKNAKIWASISLIIALVSATLFFVVYNSAVFRTELAVSKMTVLNSCKKSRVADVGGGVFMYEFICNRSCDSIKNDLIKSKKAKSADPRKDSLSLISSIADESVVISMVDRGVDECVVFVNLSNDKSYGNINK